MNGENKHLTHDNPFLPEPARIVRTYYLTEDVKFFQVRIVDMEKAHSFNYRPGQFAMISVVGAGEAPFSISSTPSRPGLLEFCIRKAGAVTNALFRMKENDLIGFRGPYGNGVPVEKMKDKDIIIVVGGLGAAPLRSVLLYSLDNRDQFRRISLLHGAKKPAEMIFREEFFALKQREDLECHLVVDEDDTGTWTENIGVVTTLFSLLKEIDPVNTYALVCGPPIMLKYTMPPLLDLGFSPERIITSLERRMSCGIGKCGRCNIGSKYICKDGPVFTYKELRELPEVAI